MKKYFVGYLALLVTVLISLAGISYADRAIRPVDQTFNVQTYQTTKATTCTGTRIAYFAWTQLDKKFKDNVTPYGNPDQSPWCAYFAYWALKKAGCTPLQSNFEGNSRELLEWFGSYHQVVWSVKDAKQGDVIVWKKKTDPLGHTGIVWDNRPATKEIWLIEGNVRDDVEAKHYTYDSIQNRGSTMELYGFGRW